MELVRALEAVTPDTPHNSVHGAIQNLLSTRTSEIVKVARGTYQLVKFVDADNALASAQEIATETAQVKAEAPGSETLTEQDFYASFAEWLVENDEVTVAFALGGNRLIRGETDRDTNHRGGDRSGPCGSQPPTDGVRFDRVAKRVGYGAQIQSTGCY
jgi:hypothetical protein